MKAKAAKRPAAITRQPGSLVLTMKGEKHTPEQEDKDDKKGKKVKKGTKKERKSSKDNGKDENV